MKKRKSYTEEDKQKAMALLAVKSLSQVSKELSIPKTTLLYWQKEFDKNATEQNEPTIEQLRTNKKKEFAEMAWKSINKIQTLLERRLERAVQSEDKIDELLFEILELDGKDLTKDQRKALYQKISSIKVESVKELAVVLGTLYDKQALANNESTQNIRGTIENVIKQIEGDEY